VIGGQNRDKGFTDLINGTSRVEGPFRNYSDAERVWKSHTEETRSDAQTRYTIVTCAANPRRQQAA
jgi:hypothetical protein